MERDLNLSWSELLKISDPFSFDKVETGVYIWGFTIDKIFVPYYVGFATNIFYRIHEHINNLIGGKYTVFHKNSLAYFKDFKDQPISTDQSNGRIYLPDWPRGYKYFLNNRKDIQPHIDYMVDTFTFSYAPVTADKYSRTELKDIEKKCISQIGIENLINTKGGESTMFKIQHSGNQKIMNVFKTATR